MLIHVLPASDDVGATMVNEDKLRLSEVGRIVVKVSRYTGGLPAGNNYRPEMTSLKNTYDNAVHEKALKGDAKSHGISYGLPHYILKHTLKNGCSLGAAEMSTAKFNYVNCEKVDGTDYPIAIFIFKYRSNGGDASGLSLAQHSAYFKYSGLEATYGY